MCGAEGNRPRGEKARGATVQGAIIQGAIDQGGNWPGWELTRGELTTGAIDLGGNCPGGELSRGELVGGNCPGGIVRGGTDLEPLWNDEKKAFWTTDSPGKRRNLPMWWLWRPCLAGLTRSGDTYSTSVFFSQLSWFTTWGSTGIPII